MGTRHLICVVKNGEYKVAQYGQWDGYPEGQGLGILNFLLNEMNRNVFEKKLSELTFLTDEEKKQRWIDFGIDIEKCNGLVLWEDARRFNKMYPENSRNTGSDILGIIQNSNKSLKLINSIDFAKDSLFCEWAYVIDLDKNLFEVYEGFNKKPLSPKERFYSDKNSEGYYPIKLVATFSLDNLPTEKEFLACFDLEDEE